MENWGLWTFLLAKPLSIFKFLSFDLLTTWNIYFLITIWFQTLSVIQDIRGIYKYVLDYYMYSTILCTFKNIVQKHHFYSILNLVQFHFKSQVKLLFLNNKIMYKQC